MQIAIETPEKLKIRNNPVFIKVFLNICLLFGIYNFYQLSLGTEVESYNVFIFFVLPLVILNFVVSRAVIEMDKEKLIVTKIFLFRRKVVSYDLSDIRDFVIEANKGLGMVGTFTLMVKYKSLDVPLITGFGGLKNDQNADVIQKMNLFISAST